MPHLNQWKRNRNRTRTGSGTNRIKWQSWVLFAQLWRHSLPPTESAIIIIFAQRLCLVRRALWDSPHVSVGCQKANETKTNLYDCQVFDTKLRHCCCNWERWEFSPQISNLDTGYWVKHRDTERTESRLTPRTTTRSIAIKVCCSALGELSSFSTSQSGTVPQSDQILTDIYISSRCSIVTAFWSSFCAASHWSVY